MFADGDIDYSGYTRKQLLEALGTIDQANFPRNYANIRRAIERISPDLPLPKDPATILAELEKARLQKVERSAERLGERIRNWRTLPKGGLFNRLSFVRDAVSGLPGLMEAKPELSEASAAFLSRVGLAFRLFFSEREMFAFVLLQWVAIGLGYYLWVMMLYWVPEDVWRSTRDSDSGSVADIVLLAWSFACVGLVALPLGILSACAGAVAVLRRAGRESTIAACLKLASPQAFRLWMFSWIDGWITVVQILDRLPKRRDHRSLAERLADEALYYAWKLGSAGVLPALILGRGLGQAGLDSIKLLRFRLKDVMLLRVGYSTFCWVVGIGAYIGTIVFFRYQPDLIPRSEPLERHIGDIYFWAGVPILVAVGAVIVFLRPIYLIALCTLYVENLRSRGETLEIPVAPSRMTSALVAFAVFAAIVGVAALYRDELGITRWLSTPYT
jgi:hypothetical protein